MTIPVTAGANRFVPACLAEMEDAPAFTIRDATRKDKRDMRFLLESEGYMQYSQAEIRDTIVEQLRIGWTGEGIEQNITQLEAYWQALDEFAEQRRQHGLVVLGLLREAGDGEAVDLPPEPELDFDKATASALDALVDEVTAGSRRVSQMIAHNNRFQSALPMVCLRLLLRSTTLKVELSRSNGVITEDSCEALLEALQKVDPEDRSKGALAAMQLFGEVAQAFTISEDAEKNSSSPRSGSTPPKASAEKPSPSTSEAEASSSPIPADADTEAGPKSSD